jgi:hypothetical protein
MAARILACAVAVAVACGVACGGGDGSPQMPDRAAGANQKPLIEQLRLEPAEPVPGDDLRALVRARDPGGTPQPDGAEDRGPPRPEGDADRGHRDRE